MPANLPSAGGSFQIVSVANGGHNLGVNITLPAWQSVYLDGPANTFTLRAVGPGKYRISVGGYPYTGELYGTLEASIYTKHETEWKIDYREQQDAYTIVRDKQPHLGWTVPSGNENAEVKIQPIISTKSIPPQFIPSQLFKFEPVNE